VADFVCVKQDLHDGLNYGLFCPPDNGRAGKFMDEERLLTDYPLPGPIGYLEVTLWRLYRISPDLSCKYVSKIFI